MSRFQISLFMLTITIATLSLLILPTYADQKTSDVTSEIAANGCCELAGDFDNNGAVDIGDLTSTVDFMFRGGPAAACQDEADVDGSGDVNISDLTYRVDYMFRGGPPLVCGSYTLVLFDGVVSPGSGIVTDSFTYIITFKDTLGQMPLQAEVFVNDLVYPLTMNSGSLITGALFETKLLAAIGQNTYYFRFVQSTDDTVYYPDPGYEIGPQVSADTLTQIAENAVVMDSLPGVSLAGFSADSITFNISGAVPPTLNPGDIIVGTDSIGFFRKVVSSSWDGAQLSVATESASLIEAIENGEVSDTFNLIPPGFVPSMGRQTIGNSEVEMTLAEGVSYSAGTFDFSGLTLFTITEGGESYTITVPSGTLSFDPEMDFKLEFKSYFPPRLQEFRGIASGALSLSASVQVTSSYSYSASASKKLAEIKNKKLFFLPNGFPVYVETTLRLNVGCTATLEAAMSVTKGFSSTRNIEVGATQLDGVGWNGVWNSSGTFNALPITWNGTAQAVAQLYIKPEIEIRFYSILGVELNAKPFSQFTGNVYFEGLTPCWDWTLFAGMSGSADIDATLLDKQLFAKSYGFNVGTVELASDFLSGPPCTPVIPLVNVQLVDASTNFCVTHEPDQSIFSFPPPGDTITPCFDNPYSQIFCENASVDALLIETPCCNGYTVQWPFGTSFDINSNSSYVTASFEIGMHQPTFLSCISCCGSNNLFLLSEGSSYVNSLSGNFSIVADVQSDHSKVVVTIVVGGLEPTEMNCFINGGGQSVIPLGNGIIAFTDTVSAAGVTTVDCSYNKTGELYPFNIFNTSIYIAPLWE